MIANALNEDNQEKLKHFETIFERVNKYLNVLVLFFNSKTVIADLSEHEDLLLSLIKLIGSKNSTMALLGANVIRSCIQYHSGNELKIEMANKKLLIGGKTAS